MIDALYYQGVGAELEVIPASISRFHFGCGALKGLKLYSFYTMAHPKDDIEYTIRVLYLVQAPQLRESSTSVNRIMCVGLLDLNVSSYPSG